MDRIDQANMNNPGLSPMDYELEAFNARQEDFKRAQHAEQVQNESGLGWLQRQMTPAGGAMVDALGRVVGQFGYGIKAADNYINPAGQGENFIGDALVDVQRAGNEFRRINDDFGVDAEGNMNTYQDVSSAIASSLPSLGIQAGINALTGGTGGLIGALMNPVSMGYAVASDAAGEAAQMLIDLTDKGASPDEALRQANLTFGSNVVLNAATQLAGAGMSRFGGAVLGDAGRLLGQAVEEGIQEPAQDVIHEAGYSLNADGQPVGLNQYMGNLQSAFAEGYLPAVKNTSLTSMLSTLITGGASGISQAAANYQPPTGTQTEYTIGQSPDPFGIDQTPKNETPAAQQALEELSARTQQKAVEMAAIDNEVQRFEGDQAQNLIDLMARQQVSEEPVAPVAEMVNEPVNQQPTQPVIGRREAALNWAQEELNRLTEGAEYDEDGLLTTPMEEASAQRYADIARARANNDLAALEQMRAEQVQQPEAQQDREFNQEVNPSWYHGSRRQDLDRLSIDTVGTGDGNAAHGYGISLARDKNNANMYTDPTGELDIDELGSGAITGAGRVYAIEGPSDTELLNYDEPISKQSDGIRKAIQSNPITSRYMDFTGRELYDGLQEGLGSDKAASEFLANIGIPGARYLENSIKAGGPKMPEAIIYDASVLKIQPQTQVVDESRGDMSFNQRVDDIYDRVAAGTTDPKTAANELFQMAYSGGPTDHAGDFDTKYIGSGQGQKVHGWGLYFSSMQRVSERYRRTYSRPTGVKSIGGQALTSEEERVMGHVNPFLTPSNVGHLRNDRAELDDNQWLQEAISTAVKLVGNQISTKDANILRGIIKKAGAGKVKFAGDGQLFEVDIPDNNELLRETATFAKQSPEVQKLLADYVNSKPTSTVTPETPMLTRDGKPIYKDDLAALANGNINEKYISFQIQNLLDAGKPITFDAVYDELLNMADQANSDGDQSTADEFDNASSYFEEHFQDYVSDKDLESDSPVIMYVEGQPVYEDMPEQTRDDMEPEVRSTFNVLMTFKNLGGIDITDERQVLHTIQNNIIDLRTAVFDRGFSLMSPEGLYETLDDAGLNLFDYNSALEFLSTDRITLKPVDESGTGQGAFVNSREAREMIRVFTEPDPGDRMTGEDLYNNLKYTAKRFDIREADKAVSELLDSIGIPGLVYTGENVWSGNRKGVDNFVIWNNDRIQTLKKFYQKQMEALAKTQTLDAPSDETLDVDSHIYDDALAKLEKAGITGVEAQVNARLYSRAFNSFGLLFNQDANTLWDGIEFDVSREDLTTPDGRPVRGVARFSDDARGVPQKMRLAFDFKNSDTSSSFHEMFHIFHEMVKKGAMEGVPVLQQVWQDMQDFAQGDYEKLANGGMNYVLKGQVKDSAIRRVFNQFRAWLQNLWSAFTQAEKQEFNEPLRQFYDILLAEDSAFDGLYSEDNPRIGNVAGNDLSRVREKKQRKPSDDDLIAIREVSLKGLESILNDGFEVAPSIGVVNRKDASSNFGEVSIIYGKDTINPDLSPDNRVYYGDGWTPMHNKAPWSDTHTPEGDLNTMRGQVYRTEQSRRKSGKPQKPTSRSLAELQARRGSQIGTGGSGPGNKRTPIYDEAKPMRKVPTSEILGVVLPTTADKNLQAALKKAKIPFSFYNSKDSRSREVASFADTLNQEQAYFQNAYTGRTRVYDKLDTKYVGNGTGAIYQGWGIYLTKDFDEANSYTGADGKVHVVDIPETEDLLDLDKTIGQQSQKVKDKLASNKDLAYYVLSNADRPAWSIYSGIALDYGLPEKHWSYDLGDAEDPNVTKADTEAFAAFKKAAEVLKSAGIPGLTFAKSSEFVIWDNEAMKVLQHKNAERELNQEATKRSTKGNVTTVQQVVDRSDVVNPARQVNSPSVIAKLYKKFAPVYDLGVSAMRQQRSIKAQYSHAIDKVFGKPSLFGRTGGIAKTKAEREDIHNALITGDMFGRELTEQELVNLGISENGKAGYRRMRQIYKNLGAKLNAQRAKYGKGEFELREGYVPHIFHHFRVHDADGQMIQSFDRLSDAQKYAKSIATDGRQITIKPAMQDFGGKAKQDAVTVGDLQYFKLVQNVANVFALNQEDAKEFTGEVARMANKSRFLGASKFREGYAGYDMDMEYAARHYANIASRYIAMDEFKHHARRYFERSFGRFDRQYKGIASYTKDYINDILGIPTAWEDAENKLVEASGLVKWLPADYQERPALAIGNKWLGSVAVLKLGLMNFGSALVNLSSLNGVAAKTGYKYATKAIGEYSASLAKPKMELLKLYEKLGLGEDLTQASASSYSKASDYRRQALKVLGQASSGMYSYMDGAARKLAAIAGYRKALSEGKSIPEATAYAREVVDQTNFNYGVEDTPNIMRRTGQTGAIAMQFKKYPIKAWELGMNHLEGMERVKYWGGMLVLGGLVGGIPLFSAISYAAKALFPEKDLELEIKRTIADLPLPNPVKRTLLYGALSNIGINVSSRVGLGDALSMPAGPTVSTLQQIAQGMTKIFQGQEGAYWDTVEALAPGLGNPGKAFAGQSEDARTGRVKTEYTPGERVARGIGFTPIRESVESDAMRLNNYEKTEQSAQQQLAMRAYMSDRSPANRDRLRETGVTPAQMQRFMKANARPGSRYEQSVQDATKPAQRDRLQTYGGM
jgi:hypothetical protein